MRISKLINKQQDFLWNNFLRALISIEYQKEYGCLGTSKACSRKLVRPTPSNQNLRVEFFLTIEKIKLRRLNLKETSSKPQAVKIGMLQPKSFRRLLSTLIVSKKKKRQSFWKFSSLNTQAMILSRS
mgnify:CR=1 FL=1